MVYRLYVEKKPGFDHEAQATLKDIQSFLRIPELTNLRLLNRYDVEGLDEELFRKSIPTVFSEPCPASSTSAPTLPASASSWPTAATAR